MNSLTLWIPKNFQLDEDGSMEDWALSNWLNFLTLQTHTLEEEMFSIWGGWLMSIGQHGVTAKLYEEIVQYASPTQVSAVFSEQSLPHSSHFGRKLKDNPWKAVESPSHTGTLETEKQPYTFGGFFLSNFFCYPGRSSAIFSQQNTNKKPSFQRKDKAYKVIKTSSMETRPEALQITSLCLVWHLLRRNFAERSWRKEMNNLPKMN